MDSARRRCRRCSSPLAQDNTDALCSVCADKRPRDRAPEVPPEFWHTALVGTGLASRDLGRVIRMYRYHPAHRQPLHQSVVADWLYVSAATLSRIEHGKRHVTIDEIASFTRALGMPLALRWVHQQPTEAGDDVEPISRRSLLGTAGVGAALGLGAAFTAPASARQIDPALASHWTDLLRVLNRHDANFGPRDVLPTVRHEIGLITEHRQIAGGKLRTELLRTEARWSEFASWLSDDAGDADGRDAWADRALGLAKELGDPDLVAWMLGWRSQWAADRSDPRQAIAFAQAARDTRGTTKRIRALSALEEAHGHALAKDAAACERSLAAADGLLDADTDSRDDLGSQNITAPYVLAANARCWISLAPHKAVATFEDALRHWPDDRQRSRGIRQAQLALGCAAAGEPDRAAGEGVKALDIAQRTRSDATVRELRRLDRRLTSCDLPEAAHFREALATL